MYSKSYLLWGGGLLLVAGILGLIGVIGPGADSSVFDTGWFFSGTYAWINLIAGAIALLIGLGVEDAQGRRSVAIVLASLAALAGFLGLIMPTSFSDAFGAGADNIVTNIFYLAFGAWGLIAALAGSESTTTHTTQPHAV